MWSAAKIKPEEKSLNTDIVLHAQAYHWKSLMSWPSACVLETESYYQFIYLSLNEDFVWNKAVQRSFKLTKLQCHCRQLLQHSVWMPVHNLFFMHRRNFIQCYSDSVYYSDVQYAEYSTWATSSDSVWFTVDVFILSGSWLDKWKKVFVTEAKSKSLLCDLKCQRKSESVHGEVNSISILY